MAVELARHVKTVNGAHAQKTVGAAEHRYRLRWSPGWLAVSYLPTGVGLFQPRPAMARVGALAEVQHELVHPAGCLMYSRELDLMEGDRNRPLLATRGEESVVCMQMSARCAPPPWRSPLGVAQHCKFWSVLVPVLVLSLSLRLLLVAHGPPKNSR